MKVPPDRILREEWGDMVQRSCEECSRAGCGVKTGAEFLRCEGWCLAGCMAIERSEMRKGRKGLPYWYKGEREEA